MKKLFKESVIRKISQFSPSFQKVVQYCPLAKDDHFFLDRIAAKNKGIATVETDLVGNYQLVLINGNFNYDDDIQGSLDTIHCNLHRTSRVCIISYSPYLELLYRLLNRFNLLKGEVPTTFLTLPDLKNLAMLSNFSVVKHEAVGVFPPKLLGIGNLINTLFNIVPFIRIFSPLSYTVLRPIKKASTLPSLSVVIPARNEEGNIENALLRMPNFGCDLEVIFVEGNSKDGTAAEIARVKEKYKSQYKIKSFTQSGKGKANAVEKGFHEAEGELLTILDADLTMPPELLPRFYNSFCEGQADFINGSRLLYPMENNAMRFLNKLGNVFFSKALSFVLSRSYTDTLCGTKLFLKTDWDRFLEWREDFGKHDPFGDFDMIFPSSILCLDTVDIPIKYRDRVYGETNIQRFRHGLMLLKMTLIGFFKIKLK